MDQKFGIRRPHGAPLVINNKIVEDFKTELDKCRLEKTIHPHLKKLNKNFIPTQHPMLHEWKNSFKGTGFHHRDTNFFIYGIIDDIWHSEFSKKIIASLSKALPKKNNLILKIYGLVIGDSYHFIRLFYLKILYLCPKLEFLFT